MCCVKEATEELTPKKSLSKKIIKSLSKSHLEMVETFMFHYCNISSSGTLVELREVQYSCKRTLFLW